MRVKYLKFPRRRKTKFGRFITSYGVASLANDLRIDPAAIYHWIRGATAPRRTHAEIIQRLARERGSRLTMDEIYQHARAVRADEVKPEREILPSRAA